MKRLDVIILTMVLTIITAGYSNVLAQSVEATPSDEVIRLLRERELQPYLAQWQIKQAEYEAELALKEEQQAALESKYEAARVQMDLMARRYADQERSLGVERDITRAMLVVPNAEMPAQDLAQIAEDISIMARIFDSNLTLSSQVNQREGMMPGMPGMGASRGSAEGRGGRGAAGRGGRSFSLGGRASPRGGGRATASRGGRSAARSRGVSAGRPPEREYQVHPATKGMYLQGYGILFSMNVDMMLYPLAKEREVETDEAADAIWAKAKRELQRPQKSQQVESTAGPEYHAEVVQELEQKLVEHLKHAANIRHLQPDEWVILNVFGQGGQIDGAISVNDRKSWSQAPPSEGFGAVPSSAARPSVLTLRAQRSDIEAFATGELTLDEFQQRVLTFLHSSPD